MSLHAMLSCLILGAMPFLLQGESLCISHPELFPAEENMIVRQGESAILRCELDDQEGRVAWLNRSSILFSNNDKWSSDPRVRLITNNKTEYTIEIQNVDDYDKGSYTCASRWRRMYDICLIVQAKNTTTEDEVRSGAVAPEPRHPTMDMKSTSANVEEDAPAPVSIDDRASSVVQQEVVESVELEDPPNNAPHQPPPPRPASQPTSKASKELPADQRDNQDDVYSFMLGLLPEMRQVDGAFRIDMKTQMCRVVSHYWHLSNPTPTPSCPPPFPEPVCQQPQPPQGDP